MAQIRVPKAYRDTKTTTKCQPKTCPTCGGVECFERPRFFCGQLLTDKDLDAAQRYVIEKNKLHNRHLVGTGVVCGLPVYCDPCDGYVVIEPGYAIDCCGNDIVVCDPYRFDVIEYIKKCFKQDEPGCEGKIRPPRERCDDRPKEYCLILSYTEEAARPVTALVRNNGCSTKKCEPSRTREGFRIDLVLKETEEDKPRNDFWSHVVKCFADVLRVMKKFFDHLSKAEKNRNLESQHSELLSILCRLEDDILKLYRKGANVRCTLAEELSEIESRFPASRQDPQYTSKVYHSLFTMFGRLLQFLIDCICDALLVPCPPCDGEGVLLACVTVNDGKVVKICNIVRTQLLTGPAVRYYIQPLFTVLHKLFEYLCCELDLGQVFDRLFRIRDDNTPESSSGLAENTFNTASTGNTANTGNTASAGGTTPPSFLMAQAVAATFNRSEAAVKFGRDYSTRSLLGIRTANLLQFTNPNVVTAMDVYGATLEDATENLARRGVTVSESRMAKSDGEAYQLKNLTKMTWVVPTQSRVELIVAPDNRVTFIRVIGGK